MMGGLLWPWYVPFLIIITSSLWQFSLLNYRPPKQVWSWALFGEQIARKFI